MQRWLLALAAGGSLCAAALAETAPGFPRVQVASMFQVDYDEASGLLNVQTGLESVRFAPGADPLAVRGGDGFVAGMELNVALDGQGRVLAGGADDDLVLRGALDRDGDGVAETSGVLLTGAAFAYVEIDEPSGAGVSGGARGIGLAARSAGDPGDLLLRFAPTGGALVGHFVGRDIAVRLRADSGWYRGSGLFDGRGRVAARGTVRGACCTFPNACEQVTELECDALGGDFLGIGSACVEPNSPLDIGRHRLVGRPFGGAADAGLVLDNFGDPAETLTYSFGEAGAEVFLDYDGSVAFLSGTAIGGPTGAGRGGEEVYFEFAYTQATSDGTQITAPAMALAFGFVQRIDLGETVILGNGAAGLTIDATGQLDGSLDYFFAPGNAGLTGFHAQVAEAAPTCAAALGACCGFDGGCSQTTAEACDALSGSFAGAGTSCGDDADGDGVADACDICPGGDDNLDSDGDGIPNYCDSDPGLSNGGCCLSFGCIILDSTECAQMGGVYQGDGTSCWECN